MPEMLYKRRVRMVVTDVQYDHTALGDHCPGGGLLPCDLAVHYLPVGGGELQGAVLLRGQAGLSDQQGRTRREGDPGNVWDGN